VRLFLRKTSAWHRIRNLGYHSDISDLDTAAETLQRIYDLPASSAEVQTHPGELEPPAGTFLGTSFTFADRSETEITTLEEASSLLKLDELKALAKDAKVQGKNKRALLNALRRTSREQAGLGHVGLKRSDSEMSRRSSASNSRPETPEVETPVEELSDDGNRDAHFTRKIMSETGPCIRLALATLKLFERVHLVFYRSTEWTEKSLTTIILAKIARRNFPEYIVSRSANIFATRSLLLEYEASIRTQSRIDNILEFNGRPTEKDHQEIIDTFEQVYPRWQAFCEEEQRKEDSIYHSGEGSYLRRLSPAWVYTRIIHKALYILGRRKEHKREHELLTELLRQRLFHHTRRGAWYQRKALLEEHYMAALTDADKRNEEQQKKHWKRISLQTCEEGLQDNLVHIIHHYDLQKRVPKLERALNSPNAYSTTLDMSDSPNPLRSPWRASASSATDPLCRAEPARLIRTQGNAAERPSGSIPERTVSALSRQCASRNTAIKVGKVSIAKAVSCGPSLPTFSSTFFSRIFPTCSRRLIKHVRSISTPTPSTPPVSLRSTLG
jgi:Fanconi-associated nuclease 1